MADIIRTPRVSGPVPSLDTVQPTPAKASLRSPAPSLAVQTSPSLLTVIVKDALLRHYGSLKAAAITMGEMDQAQLTRELDNGKLNLARLELLDDAGKASLSQRLIEAFGAALEAPSTRARRIVREMRSQLDELDQFFDLAS